MLDILIWAWIFNNFYHLYWSSHWFLYCTSIYCMFWQVVISIWAWGLFFWASFLSRFCWFNFIFSHWLLLWSYIVKSCWWISTDPLPFSFADTIFCNCGKINCWVLLWTWKFCLFTVRCRPRSFGKMILCFIKFLILW